MVDDENESLMDTISSAVETQKSNAEPAEEAPKEEAEEAPEPKEPAQKERDASGRFLPKEAGSKEVPETEQEHTENVDKSELQQEPAKPDISRPPRRLPIRTKGIWQTLPETVREDIWAREQEYDTAFKRYDGLGQFVMQAEKNGTNLPAAIADYHAMETALRRDPIDGAMLVWQRMGYNAQVVMQELLRRVGGQAGQPAPQTQAAMPSGLTRQEMEIEFARRDNMAKIEAFENDPKHLYLEPLNPMGEQGPIRSAMIHFLTPIGPDNKPLAKTLEDAYDMALRLHPEIARLNGSQGSSSTQAKKTAAVNQSRAAAKAIGGAPSQGSNAGQKSPDDGNQSIFDTVRAAVARQRG